MNKEFVIKLFFIFCFLYSNTGHIVAQEGHKQLYEKALELIEEEEYDDAKEILLKITKNDPNNYLAFFELAKIEEEDGEEEEAEKYFLKVHSINVEFSPALTRLGRLYQEMGKEDEAKQYYLLAWIVDPRSEPAILNVSTMLLKNGQFELAKNLLENAPVKFESEDNKNQLIFNMGFIYYFQNDWQKARETWKPLIESRHSLAKHIEGLYYTAGERE